MEKLWVRKMCGKYIIMKNDFPFETVEIRNAYNLNMEIFTNKMKEFNCEFTRVYFYSSYMEFENEKNATMAKEWIESQIVMNKLRG